MSLNSPEQYGAGLGKTHRADIDGLRAIAVLAVIGFHCKVPFLGGGFVGVDVFFVISGYLICSIIYKEMRGDRFSIARFYERRCKRIVPALAVVLLFCMVLAAMVLSPMEAHRFGDSAVATSLSASNILFILRSGYFAVGAMLNILLMTWSLAVEEQFYVVFPLIMLALRGRRRRTIVAWLAAMSALSLVCSIYAEFRQPTWNFYLPVTRAWELGAGALLAVWQEGRLRFRSEPSRWTDATGAAGIAMVLAAVFAYNARTRFPGYEAILPVLGSALILMSAGGRANRILAIRPLVAIGLISYSLYLWHWPLLSFAEVVSSRPLRPITMVLLMTTAFAAATLSYFFVETPFRTKRAGKTNKVLFSYGLAILALASLGGVFSITKGLPWRYPELYGIESRADLDRHHPCTSSGDYLRMSSQCVPPPSSTVPAMAVLGDSHAEALAEGLRDFTAKSGWNLVTLTREACAPLKGVIGWWPGSTYADSCRSFNQTALQYVLNRPDIRVVLLTGLMAGAYMPDSSHGGPVRPSDAESAAVLGQGFKNEIDTLESAGKRVILMEDVPGFPDDPVAGIRYQQIPLRRLLNRLLLSESPEIGDGASEDISLTTSTPERFASAQLEAIAAADRRVILIDPKKAFCSAGRCYYASATELFYADGGHLSRSGALHILPLMPDLNAILRPDQSKEN
jgi:peptidoglycan/LPS O-acetylase OafA/YrhL